MTEGVRKAILAWHRTDGTIVDFPLEGRALVGREVGARVLIDEPLVSRTHAEIVRRGGSYVLRDLNSTNSTRVNGEVVAERELRDGDEVRFGRARCLFRYAEAQDGPAPAEDECDPSPGT